MNDSGYKHEYEKWDLIIRPDSSGFGSKLKELLRYRDLILLFVRRDFIANYKQTILGPLWHIIQPLLTTLTFVVIFGNFAKISTDGTPAILFYMSGIICWTYFSSSLTKTSTTFISNANIFSKVYFPRLVIPISVVLSNLFSFGVQLILLITFTLYFSLTGGISSAFGWSLLVLPLLVLIMAIMGLGIGILVSSLTTRYRDLNFLIGFSVQLLMYFSAVIFPISSLTGKWKLLIQLNPMSPVIEAFRFVFLGKGDFNILWIIYSALVAVLMLYLGLVLFNRVERNFNDTV
jgi:lipopolysaccharide transport system permease protein